jgi:putative transposase
VTIKEWQKELYQGAVDRGFYEGELGEKTPVHIASMLAMVHSEVSEALEELRVGALSTKFMPQGLGYPPPADFKYRQQVFTSDAIVSDLKTMLNQIAGNFDVQLIESGVGVDHLHILFRCKPTLDLPKFINAVKRNTSRNLRNQYAQFLQDKLWGDAFWSPSYFLATTGNVTIDVIKNYVENQRVLQQ